MRAVNDNPQPGERQRGCWQPGTGARQRAEQVGQVALNFAGGVAHPAEPVSRQLGISRQPRGTAREPGDISLSPACGPDRPGA